MADPLQERRGNIVQCLFRSQERMLFATNYKRFKCLRSYPQPNFAPLSLHFNDPALSQGHPPVHAGCEIHVVRSNDRREPGRGHELRQRPENMLRGMDIEISSRLVSQENAWGIGNRTRNGDTLLFTARKLRRPMI